MPFTFENQGLQRLANGAIFAKGVQENRVVITFDLDFSDIAALGGHGVASVILFRLHNARCSHVISRLSVALAEAAGALQSGAIVGRGRGPNPHSRIARRALTYSPGPPG